MTTTINASPSNGLIQTADGSGVLKVQSNGVTTNALAWVNFNGTGTVAIRSSYNVSSITDNGTGDYTVNFATALSDANYAPLVTASGIGGFIGTPNINTTNNLVEVAPTTSSFRLILPIWNNSAGNVDQKYVAVSVFGN